jgi:hypothetical protein
MSDRRTVVVTAYGHDKIVDKIAVSTFGESDNYRFPSDAATYCETINALTLDGNSWVCAKICSENVQYSLNDFFPLKFDTLLSLDDRSLQKVIRNVDSLVLTYALKGASEEIKEKVFRNMSKRGAEMLKEDMDCMGTVRFEKSKPAQDKILNVISELEKSGEIRINDGGCKE